MLGTVIPFIGRAIAPCDSFGIPLDGEDAEHAQFETPVFMVAWLGQYAAFGFGAVTLRTVDPTNPRRYQPGNLFQ